MKRMNTIQREIQPIETYATTHLKNIGSSHLNQKIKIPRKTVSARTRQEKRGIGPSEITKLTEK